MTFMPVFITIDERMKRGLCSPLLLGDEPQAGVWYHGIPGTDVMETVYDPRFIDRTGPYSIRPKRTMHIGGYFEPGAPLPLPTGPCRDPIYTALGQVDRSTTMLAAGAALVLAGSAWWWLHRRRRR